MNLALIITYNPSKDFFAQLDSFYEELDQIIIVDNASAIETRSLLKQEQERRGKCLKIIFNEDNYGVATALNQGFLWAIEQGAEQILAFDQDSYPSKGAMTILLDFYKENASKTNLAVVASIPSDSQVGSQTRFLRKKTKLRFERTPCDGQFLPDISFVITSGALYNLKAYQEIGPFLDHFFIDSVDIEYCLRANQLDYQVVALCNAHLEHHLGEREKRTLLGRTHYPTFHSPLRWYYISRNRIPMLKKYAFRFPHWLSFEIVSSVYIFLRMLLFEDKRAKKLLAVFLGTWDGILGRMGKATPKIVKALL